MRARMRQPPARPTLPFTAPPTERLARAPFKAAPRASLPLTARSPEGNEPPDLEDAAVGIVNRSHPLRGRPADAPLAERALVPRCRVDALTSDSRHPRWLNPPFARDGSVVGPPVARWTVSLGISYLVEPTRRCERSSALGLYALRTGVLRTLRLG
jgi:hypothetical protein